jgi:hypothetical protein
MRKCSKCKIDKETSEFYTYWHSKYNRHFTRKTCTSCFIKQQVDKRKERKLKLQEERKEMIEVLTQQIIVQPEVPELIVEDFSNNPNYRKCTICEKYLTLSTFYFNKKTGYYHSRCKPCLIKYTNGKQVEYYEEKYKTRGGSEFVMNKAGNFTDKFQEAQTVWLLETIGWTRNEDGIFTKQGIKEIVNGEIVWPKVPKKEKVIQLRKSRLQLKASDIKNIVELRKKGLLMREIAVIYKCSKTLIGQILMRENEKKD